MFCMRRRASFLALCVAARGAGYVLPGPAARCGHFTRAQPPHCSSTASVATLFPQWPESAVSGRRELQPVLDAFVEVVSGVPLKASSEAGDGWREWRDGGYAAHKFAASKLSRRTYVPILSALLQLLVACQAKYPDLYAVLKFVPKKNGLNPFLARLSEGQEEAVAIEQLKPREVRRRLDDLQRSLEQSWLLIACYLTLPEAESREDMLWSARTVVEKVKTDQRTRAVELLCLGFFERDAALYPLATASRALSPAPEAALEAALVGGVEAESGVAQGGAPRKEKRRARKGAGKGKSRRLLLKGGFESNFGVGSWHPKPTNARMIWQRSRMAYPFLEMAHRARLSASGAPLGGEGLAAGSLDAANAAAVGELLDRIARASPEEKVINSLVYFIIDICYKAMLEGEDTPRWDPQPYLLRKPGVEAKLVAEISQLGHLLQLLSRAASRERPDELARGEELLLEVKEVETTCTLLAAIRSSCGESCPEVLAEYDELMSSSSLSLQRLEALEFEALGSLLGLEGSYVAEHADTVRSAMREWRNPELLFRFLDDNRGDDRMVPLITRWLRAIFGLSEESLRQIRRESPENVRHLLQIPQPVLLRWYSNLCPGTSKCKTLFMLGEDAGSCLRIISNDGNRYNRALMGYVLQSHVRALVITDAVGRVMARSLIRLVLRSDTLTPVVFCDPMFFTVGYSKELQRELLKQAHELEEHMRIPVVHAGCVLPVEDEGTLADGFTCSEMNISFTPYVRRVTSLDYDVTWVDLIEMDGVAPYTYSEEQAYDEFLEQHSPGVQTRSPEEPTLVVAALPRADSPSAERYVREREGETAWTMPVAEGDIPFGAKTVLPSEVAEQLTQRDHVDHTYDPNARAWDQERVARRAMSDKRGDEGGEADELPENFKGPSLDE